MTAPHPRDLDSPGAEPPNLGLWWTIMVAGSLISLGLNVRHAWVQPDGPNGNVALAITYAVVPVAFAALLSEGLGSPLVGPWPRRAIVGLFLLAMAMSITAQASVMEPYGGQYGRWGIPVILDASTLLALHVITKAKSAAAQADRERAYEAEVAARLAVLEAAKRRELEADMTARLADAEAAIAAAGQAQYEVDMAAAQADMRAEFQAAKNAAKEAMKADLAAAQADMEAAMTAATAAMKADISREAEADKAAELTAREAAIQADTAARYEADMAAAKAAMQQQYEADMSAAKAAMAARYDEDVAAAKAAMEPVIRRQVRAEMAADKSRSGKSTAAAKPAAASRPAPTDGGLSRTDRAKQLLKNNPDMDGAELGRLLGMSERTGRRVRKDILAELRGQASVQADITGTDGAGTDADMAAIEADIDAATAADVTATDADIDGGHVRLVAVK